MIADARVSVTEVSTGVVASVTANSTGDYRLETLRPGIYGVSVSANGFKALTISKIELLVAQTSRVDATLELGSTSESITVSGLPPLLQTESSERGAVLGGTEVEALPLQSRNITELTFLVPGVASSPSHLWWL